LNNETRATEPATNEHDKELPEPKLRPEYVEKMREREKEPTVKVKDFKKHSVQIDL